MSLRLLYLILVRLSGWLALLGARPSASKNAETLGTSQDFALEPSIGASYAAAQLAQIKMYALVAASLPAGRRPAVGVRIGDPRLYADLALIRIEEAEDGSASYAHRMAVTVWLVCPGRQARRG